MTDAQIIARMTDGDIYFWKWKPEMGRNNFGAFGDYHCCSQVAIVHNGKPLDTYWMNFGSSFMAAGWADSRNGARSVCVEAAEFTFVANTSDLEEIRHGEEKYYRRQDIVDLRNANNSSAPIYRRTGTKRNEKVMRDLLQYNIEKAMRDISSAERELGRYEKQLEALSNGRTDFDIS